MQEKVKTILQGMPKPDFSHIRSIKFDMVDGYIVGCVAITDKDIMKISIKALRGDAERVKVVGAMISKEFRRNIVFINSLVLAHLVNSYSGIFDGERAIDAINICTPLASKKGFISPSLIAEKLRHFSNKDISFLHDDGHIYTRHIISFDKKVNE